MSDIETTLPPGDVPATPVPEAGTATAGESAIASENSTSGEQSSPSSISGTVSTSQAANAEVPNVAPAAAAGAPEAGDAPAAGGDVPNAAPAAVAPTTAPASATSAAGAGTTSPIGVSSPGEPGTYTPMPLRAQVAQHLEAIYSAVANADKPVIDEAVGLKEHIGGVLQSIHNGMDVRTGEMVQKLEALFHKL